MSSTSREGSAPGAQEVELLWRIWDAPAPRASLLLVHGLGEHSGRYDEFARAAAREGISVFAFDLRGHGRSPGARGDVDAFPRLLEDLLAMEGEAARQIPGSFPRFLMGHSLGGLICMRRLQVFKGPYAGAVISAPWLATALPDWLRALGRFLGVILPGFPLPAGVDPERLTRDPEKIQELKEDALIHRRITGRFFREAERVQGKVLGSRWPEDLPALFLVPTHDRVVRSRVTEAFLQGIVGKGIQVEILEGRAHEPLNDIGREEVHRVVLDWLATQVAVREGILPPPGDQS